MAVATEAFGALAAATVQPGLPQDALREVGHAVVALRAQHGQQVEALVAGLPEGQRQGLARVATLVT